MYKFVYFSLLLITLNGCSSHAQKSSQSVHSESSWISVCKDWDDWDKPAPPFRVFANTYYVGTCGISAILITSDDGHILIDGGTEAGAKVIANNITNLGFPLSEVKLLLHSHEHFDHVAGLAELQERSGARLLASPAAVPVLMTGVVAQSDPQAGMHDPFPAAKVDAILQHGEPVILGGLSLQPIFTPGHSPGAVSWQWTSCEGERCLSVVYADSLSPISRDDYRFSDHPAYVANYQQGLLQLAELPCDILLAPHPSAAQMPKRLASAKGLIDPLGCRAYAKVTRDRLQKRLRSEADKP